MLITSCMHRQCAAATNVIFVGEERGDTIFGKRYIDTEIIIGAKERAVKEQYHAAAAHQTSRANRTGMPLCGSADAAR